MAGKARHKLDYAGWSVDIFDNDTKIDKLLDAQGWVGFSIYFYLCQRAFGSDGYFYRWGFDDCASTARRMGCGVGSGTINEVVSYCFQIGLFDRRLFDRWGVLTSKGIQRSYWTVAKTRRDRSVFKELWLLDKSECESIIFVPFNNDMSATNDHSQATNNDMSATNDIVVEESRVEESRVGDVGLEPVNPTQGSNIQIPLVDKTFYEVPIIKIEEWKEAFPAVNIENQLRRMLVWCNANPKRKKTRRGVERFITNWLSREQDRGSNYSGQYSIKDNTEDWANG